MLKFFSYVHDRAQALSNALKLVLTGLVASGIIAFAAGFAAMKLRGKPIPRWLSPILANKGVWTTLIKVKKILEPIPPLLLGATLLVADTSGQATGSAAEYTLGRVRLTLEASQDENRFAALKAQLPHADATKTTPPPEVTKATSRCHKTEDDDLCAILVRVFERETRDRWAGPPPPSSVIYGEDNSGDPGPRDDLGGSRPKVPPRGGPTPISPSHPSLDALIARDAILRTAAVPGLTEVPPGQDNLGVSGDDASVVAVVRDAMFDQAPRSPAGADVAEHLRPLLASIGPEGRQRLRAAATAWLASFGEVMDHAALEREVVKWALGKAADFIPATDGLTHSDPSADLAREIAKKFFSEGGMHVYTALRDRFLSDVLVVAAVGLQPIQPAQSGSEVRALTAAAEDVRRECPSLERLAANAAKHPPVLRDSSSKEQAQAFVDHLATLRPAEGVASEDAKREADRLAVLTTLYQDEFPGRPDDPGPTLKQRVPPDWTPPSTGGAGALLSTDQPSPPGPTSKQIATLTRDYQAMATYGRVGGVVIGRQPSASESVIHKLRWTVEPSGWTVDLSVIEADGAVREIGSFDTDLVLRALAYAADGRVVAATIIKLDDGLGSIARRVLVHPALQGGAIGRAAIDIDRWVYDVPLNPRNPLADSDAIKQLHTAEAWMVLYRYAFASKQLDMIVRSVLALKGGANKANTKRRIDPLSLAFYESDEKVPILLAAARGTMPPWKRDFSAGLPKRLQGLGIDLWLEDCVGNPGVQNGESLRRCLASVTEGDAPEAISRLSALDRAELPRFTEVSGVREQPDNVQGTAQDPLSPFRFIVQFAFALPTHEGAEIDPRAKPDALVLADLEDPIASKLRVFLRRDEAAAHTFALMKDFTSLQRIFRAALTSPAPVPAQLAQLANDLSPLRRMDCPSPRWDSPSLADQVTQALQDVRRLANSPQGKGGPPASLQAKLQQCAIAQQSGESFSWNRFVAGCAVADVEADWRAHCGVPGSPFNCANELMAFEGSMSQLRSLSLRGALDEAAPHADTFSAICR